MQPALPLGDTSSCWSMLPQKASSYNMSHYPVRGKDLEQAPPWNAVEELLRRKGSQNWGPVYMADEVGTPWHQLGQNSIVKNK